MASSTGGISFPKDLIWATGQGILGGVIIGGLIAKGNPTAMVSSAAASAVATLVHNCVIPLIPQKTAENDSNSSKISILSEGCRIGVSLLATAYVSNCFGPSPLMNRLVPHFIFLNVLSLAMPDRRDPTTAKPLFIYL